MEVHVVIASCGFVGAFLTLEDVATKIIKEYPGINFVRYVFKLNDKISPEFVYVIPYSTTFVPAFVSNDPDECTRVKALLDGVGLSFNDDIKFWHHPVGIINKKAKTELDHMKKGVIMGENAAEVKLFEMSSRALDQFLAETEKIDIFKDVVPCGIDSTEVAEIGESKENQPNISPATAAASS